MYLCALIDKCEVTLFQYLSRCHSLTIPNILKILIIVWGIITSVFFGTGCFLNHINITSRVNAAGLCQIYKEKAKTRMLRRKMEYPLCQNNEESCLIL